MPRTAEPLIDRIAKSITVDPASGCWLWTKALYSDKGYGAIRYQGRTISAHRASFLAYHGWLPSEVDHACHNRDVSCAGGPACQHRRCVNPEHLEAVTHAENCQRSPVMRRRREIGDRKLAKTHCPHNHPYEGNAYLTKAGYRVCMTCSKAASRARYQSTKEHSLV